MFPESCNRHGGGLKPQPLLPQRIGQADPILLSSHTSPMNQKTRFPHLSPSLLLAIPLLLAGCAATTVENAEAAHGVTKLDFKKMVVIASTPNTEARHQAEDALAAMIHRCECIQSYKLLPKEEDLNDPEKVEAAVKASGADGVAILKMLSFQTERNYEEGKVHTSNGSVSFYAGAGYGPYGYGGYGMGMGMYGGNTGPAYGRTTTYQEADSVSAKKVLQIDTRIYDVAAAKRVWSGRVISDNPSSPKQVITDAVEAVRKEMEGASLIPKSN